MTAKRPRRSADVGFTAVEVVIAMLILGIIMAPLVSSYVLGIGTVAQSNATTNGSSDALNLASFFTNDVASAYRVSTAGSCGSDTVVQFQLGASGSGANPFYVAYGATEDPGAEADQNLTPIYVLSRYTCDASNALLTSSVVASELSALPSVCSNLEPVPPCDSVSAQSGVVTLQVTEWGRNSSDAQYRFSVSGTRRVTT